MFYHMSLQHEVLIHPVYLGKELMNIIERKVYSEVEGSCQGFIGYVVCITAITQILHGMVIPGEGFVKFPVKYNALVFRPFKNEVFEGTVKQITKVGIFIDIGPLSCFVSHNSIPSNMEFCPETSPACYKSKDEENDVISQMSDVRVKIVGVRMDINGIFAIGTLLDDYLGAIN